MAVSREVLLAFTDILMQMRSNRFPIGQAVATNSLEALNDAVGGAAFRKGEFTSCVGAGMLTLYAVGRFRLLDAAGVDYSPRSQKARGIIALLALSPGLSRGRIWLQDKLWSDRGSDQSAASLRQALTDIRRQLGLYSNVLRSDRQSVSLDPSLFRTSFDRPASSAAGPADVELFEDLDIGDPHFENWIASRRLAAGNRGVDDADQNPVKPPPVLTRRTTVTFSSVLDRSDRARHLADRFVALTSKAMAAHIDTLIFREAAASSGSTALGAGDLDQGIIIRTVIRDGSPQGSLSVAVSDASSGSVFWAERTQLVSNADAFVASIGFHSFVSRAADAALDVLMRGIGPADGHELALRLFNSARLLTMTLDKDHLALADRQCAAAFELSPRGGPLAWRAFIRQISHFQYMSCDFLPCHQPAGRLAARALELFPQDSLALCVSAHTEYLFGGDTRSALRLAERSIQANPLNGLAWAALANLQTAMSDHRAAYHSARRAIGLSSGTRAARFFEFYGCIAAAGLGDYRLAMHHARDAALLSPDFAPPRRYQVALKASTNDSQGFRSALQELKGIEPSFEMKLLLDGSYPVNTMRRIPLIDNVEGRLHSGMAALLEHH